MAPPAAGTKTASKQEKIKTKLSASSPRQASLSGFLAPTTKKPHSGKVQTTLFGKKPPASIKTNNSQKERASTSKTQEATKENQRKKSGAKEDDDDKKESRKVSQDDDDDNDNAKDMAQDDEVSKKSDSGKAKRKGVPSSSPDEDDETKSATTTTLIPRPKRSKKFANRPKKHDDDDDDTPSPAPVSPDSSTAATTPTRRKKRLCIVESEEEDEEKEELEKELSNEREEGKDDDGDQDNAKAATTKTKRVKTNKGDEQISKKGEDYDMGEAKDDDDEEATVTKEIPSLPDNDGDGDGDFMDSPQKPTKSGRKVLRASKASDAHKRRGVEKDDDNEAGEKKQEATPPAKKSKKGALSVAQSNGKKKRKVNNDDDDGDDFMEGIEEKDKKGGSMEKQSTKKQAVNAARASKSTRRDNSDDDEHEEDDDDSKAGNDDDDDQDDEKDTPKKANKKKSVNDVLRASSKGKSSSAAASSTHKDDETLKSKASWVSSSPSLGVPYSALCQTLQDIEAVTSRLQIQDLLTALLRQTLLLSEEKRAEQLQTLLYLASNSVAPAYQCLELGVGDSILLKAIGEASGTQTNVLKTRYEVDGDLGTVAQNAKGKQRTLKGFGVKPKPLLAKEVLTVFRQIAQTSGSQSQKYKVDKIKGLLVRAQGSESKFIIRGLQGKLRIGLAQSTVLISLAHALVLTPPLEKKAKESKSLEERLEEAVATVKQAYSEVPSYDAIVEAAMSAPLDKMSESCSLRPGIPVSPMLAKPTKSVQEVLKRLNGQRFTCEYKYDGERAQIHMMPDGTTKVFSRNLLDTTEKYPEAPLYAQESSKTTGVSSFVLDAEVVALNRETNKLVPFQVLSTRKKAEESAESAKVQVIVQAFDLMFLNGNSLLNQTLSERRDLMKKHFLPVEGKFQYATSMDHTENGDTTVIEEFLDAAVKGQCEGLMVKTLDDNSAYEPSRRSLNWLKLKKDYLDGLGDSVDLVPLGAYHGKGKRTGVYGAYLLACVDADTEEYQSVCKIGTGFSDEDLTSLAASLQKHKLDAKSSQYSVSDALECDVWFDATLVWEIKAADLSLSSVHRGAVGRASGDNAERGIGLRFPRFIRVRDDKRPDQATTSDQILDMYYAQETVSGGGAVADEDGI